MSKLTENYIDCLDACALSEASARCWLRIAAEDKHLSDDELREVLRYWCDGKHKAAAGL